MYGADNATDEVAILASNSRVGVGVRGDCWVERLAKFSREAPRR